MMRLVAAAISFAVLAGCTPQINFNTELKGQTTVQGSPLGPVLSVFPQVGNFSNLNFDTNQDFKNNNADRFHVKSMKATAFTIKIVSPNNQDFSFLDSLEFAASAEGVAEKKVAGKTNIGSLGLAAPNPTLTLDLEDVELAPYVRANAFTISARGNGRQPSADTTLEANVKLTVGVGF
ncbi:MAG: hypothetical protein QM817_24155 [Archangium sp.]